MGQEQFGRGNVQAAALVAGRWKNIPFDASNFSAAPLTWPITKDDVQVNRYMMVGNTVFWNLIIANIADLTGATPANYLTVVAPVKVFTPLYSSTNVGTLSNPGVKPAVASIIAENVIVGQTKTHARIYNAPSAQIVAGILAFSFMITYEAGNVKL